MIGKRLVRDHQDSSKSRSADILFRVRNPDDPLPVPRCQPMKSAATLSVSVDMVNQGSPIPITPKNMFTPNASAPASSAPRLDASVNGRTGVRAKRRRIVSDPEETVRPSKPFQVKEESEHCDTMMLDKAATGEDAALDMQEPVAVTQVEVSIPTNMDTEMIASQEGGEDSPERAAVESAIDAQEGYPGPQALREEETSARRKPKTYQKRQAKDVNQSLHIEETPNSNALGKHVSAERSTPVFRTPPADFSKTPQTSSYPTRAKLAKSLKTSSNDRPSIHSGSPFSNKRRHGDTKIDDRMSPGAIKIKEEVLDPNDGRPRITGGDDEGMKCP